MFFRKASLPLFIVPHIFPKWNFSTCSVFSAKKLPTQKTELVLTTSLPIGHGSFLKEEEIPNSIFKVVEQTILPWYHTFLMSFTPTSLCWTSFGCIPRNIRNNYNIDKQKFASRLVCRSPRRVN